MHTLPGEDDIPENEDQYEARMAREARYGGSNAVATFFAAFEDIHPDGKYHFMCPGNSDYEFRVGRKSYFSKDLDPRRQLTTTPHHIFFDVRKEGGGIHTFIQIQCPRCGRVYNVIVYTKGEDQW